MTQVPLIYRDRIERRPEGYRFRFPDLPEADFTADTAEEGVSDAPAHLARALVDRIHEKNPPHSERAHLGEGIAQIPPSLAAKLLFLVKSEETGMYPAELARRLDMKPQEVHRIYRLEHSTKIDAVNMALNAIGWRIALSVEPLGKCGGRKNESLSKH